MLGIGEISVGFSVTSGLLGIVLFVVAARAYRHERTPALAFVAGAFVMFALKSLLVAYAVYSSSIEHEMLEFMDAVGDMATILLLTMPLLWPQR
jgi:hypothetical protein